MSSDPYSLTELVPGKAKVAEDIERALQKKFAKGEKTPPTSAYNGRRRAEAAATQVHDGRVRSSIDVRGTVQFNVRIAPDVKNAMLEIARHEGMNISEVGEAALRLFIEMKRKGTA
jgi:hypothetical protein